MTKPPANLSQSSAGRQGRRRSVTETPASDRSVRQARSKSETADPAVLLQRLETLRAASCALQRELLEGWKPYIRSRSFLSSAANLAAYIGLRRHDLRPLQRRLADLGLSSLGRCEGHVLATLDAVIAALRHMHGVPGSAHHRQRVAAAMEKERALLKRHTDRLLGEAAGGRWTRFMVTLPTEAADDPSFVRRLVEGGMDCARINCAHDDVKAWERMVSHVRGAARDAGRPCRVLVDLAGPKLRTGPVLPGPAVARLKVKRDALGNPMRPAWVVLDGSGRPGHPALIDRLGESQPVRLSVERPWLERLRPADRVAFRDIKGRRRVLVVERRLSDTEVLGACLAGAFVPEGTELVRVGNEGDLSGKTRTGKFSALPAEILVRCGDALLLTPGGAPGEAERRNSLGGVEVPGRIPLSEPSVFRYLEPGQPISLDDGRVRGVVKAVSEAGALVEITGARNQGERLGPDKGINFPGLGWPVPALTDKDLADLDFAVAAADIVGFSFVRSAADIDRLVEELAQRGAGSLGIVAKIETAAAVRDLPGIIAHGAGRHPFGIMIARGDLGVEIGYERLAEIQEEILWLCEAAHVPVIWATQVLESLVKQNRPSRAEITDAAMAERAECVMLNKGPYVLDALRMLDSVIARMQAHQLKKTAQLRPLHW